MIVSRVSATPGFGDDGSGNAGLWVLVALVAVIALPHLFSKPGKVG